MSTARWGTAVAVTISCTVATGSPPERRPATTRPATLAVPATQPAVDGRLEPLSLEIVRRLDGRLRPSAKPGWLDDLAARDAVVPMPIFRVDHDARASRLGDTPDGRGGVYDLLLRPTPDGLARSRSDLLDDIRRLGDALGTPSYRPPEPGR